MAAPHTYQSEVLAPLPPDIYAHLGNLDSRSHAFKEELQALNDLAQETGHRTLELVDIFPPSEVIPPAGFTSETVIEGGASLSLAQFEGRIHSLREDVDDPLVVDLHELTSDTGKKVAYCDLRPLMKSSVSKLGPDGHGGEKHLSTSLDTAFFCDLKFFADTGRMKNMVDGIPGAGYSKKRGKTMARAFYMQVHPEGEESGFVVARIADSGDGKGYEEDLFRRVFKAKFKGKS